MISLSAAKPPRKSCRGFGLIELLVAMLIGVIVAAGVVQIYLSSKQSYRVQQQLARMQESGRSAAELIGRYVRLANYRNNMNNYLVPAIAIFSSPPLVVSDGAGGSDTITVRFQGDGIMTDCSGVLVAPDAISVNVFSVRNSALVCATVAVPGIADWVALVNGVNDMQVLIGEDTTADAIPNANRYTDAAIGNADLAVSLRLVLQLDNPSLAPLAPQPVINATFALRNRIAIGLGEV